MMSQYVMNICVFGDTGEGVYPHGGLRPQNYHGYCGGEACMSALLYSAWNSATAHQFCLKRTTEISSYLHLQFLVYWTKTNVVA